ncbi:trifunctional MMPL family transporter/lysophospholipid acyltransferase/class I SAM-dependent methyltransferase [Fluviicola taffensis]|uniref:Phospholipid/glycerol acyltransferase n=1 Tax=Fluviicola taffensis (strain DSM 16823 / NCIMB 13979 / RW262) TaxID=755732 RepID=F2IDP8_FLUTR|nr:trifunctional MMPL family transporter/lysophospholipid acyltransferase/class I SAM-dependent methyltransferase [Fluviicola taffensis]AEA43421.1 phospholipid/glycerol acyltransferase [Fluviicola taffensis DSM 16823]
MIGQICARIVAFFLRKRVVFWGIFLLVLTFLGVGVSKLNINEDLYAIFPQGEEFRKFNEIVQKNKLNKQVVFSIKNQGDEELTFEQLEGLKVDLEKRFSQELSEIEIVKSVDQAALIGFLQKSSIRTLEPKDYARLEEKLKGDSIRKSLKRSADLLHGPNAFFLSSVVAQDPLGLFYEQLKQLNPSSDSGNYSLKDGVVYSRDEQYAFFFGTIEINQKDTKKLAEFSKRIEAFKQEKAKQKGLKFDYFGTFQVAVENAKQVKFDAFLTSMISISGILLLLILYYRSVLAPIYFLFPAFFGILSGAGLVGYLHPEISAISLATSSVLLGIVLDYSFHFFTHLKHLGDVVKTVKEIGSPMLLGSFTTIAALASLLFTNSVVLQNFGLIALCTLSGSVVFTLLFLPVLVKQFRMEIRDKSKPTKGFKLSKPLVRASFLLITLLSLVFLYKSSGMTFDSDMNHLSFHTKELKEKEKFYTGINPNTDKKLFVFSSAPTMEAARIQNDAVYQSLVADKEQYGISELVSLSPYLPSKNSLEKSEANWLNFWKKHSNIEREVQQISPEYGLNSAGFKPFFQWIEKPSVDKQEGIDLLNQLGLNKFVSEEKDLYSYATSITVKKDKQDLVKEELSKIEGVFILDISEMAKSMLNVVKKDFDYLFLFSSLLVFVSLLVIYGRIELTLFAAFPMVLGWIWILGISSMFDIPFNFINIIVATFIFGLGDDFSIFTTDGLIQQSRTGVNSIKSSQSGIILSGISTIIGTGVLIFAKHPAIHSIGAISVVGIGSIMLITLFLQPRIFNFFVLNRAKAGRGPITFFYFIYSILLFLYFFVGSFVLNIFLIFILIPLPIKRIKKQNVLNYLISRLAKSTIYAGFHVKKIGVDAHKLDYKNPSIIIANHSSFLDILVVLMLHPKTVIMVKKWVYNSPVFSPFIRYGGYLFAEEGADGNLDDVRKRIDEGYSIVIFPEGTRSSDGMIKRFHKGAFYLSMEMGIPIQPLLILGTHEVNPKNDFIINQGQILYKPLDRITALENETYGQFCKRATQLMRDGMQNFRKEHATSTFFTRKVMENYLLKGPILEWYIRVKWRMERTNFDFYNQLIGTKKSVVDVGCGYGYLSLFLNYYDPSRRIVGMDYDEDKIAVANNCIKLSDKINFENADIREWEIPAADVYFFNDVIHYLKPEEQIQLLIDVNRKMDNEGIIVIRDGIIELQDRLKNTKLTEILSTKWFKFNKTTNDLTFLSAKQIEQFAHQNGFSFELIEHSTKTSNVLMILKK